MPFVTVDQAVSLDGFTSGPDQSLENPFGTGRAREVTRWMMEAAEENAAEIAGIVGADAQGASPAPGDAWTPPHPA